MAGGDDGGAGGGGGGLVGWKGWDDITLYIYTPYEGLNLPN